MDMTELISELEKEGRKLLEEYKMAEIDKALTEAEKVRSKKKVIGDKNQLVAEDGTEVTAEWIIKAATEKAKPPVTLLDTVLEELATDKVVEKILDIAVGYIQASDLKFEAEVGGDGPCVKLNVTYRGFGERLIVPFVITREQLIARLDEGVSRMMLNYAKLGDQTNIK